MYADKAWAWIAVVLIGYLCGSFSGAITASRIFHNTDVRKHGSGSAGMTNTLRIFGKRMAVLVTVLDAVKTLAPLLLGQWLIGSATLVAAGAGVVLGHAFPLYYQFKGGKCVLSAAVIILYMDWRVFLVSIAIVLVLALLTKIVSIGSLVAALCAPFATWFFMGQRLEIIFVSCLAAFVIFLHRENIKRLREGRELKATKGEKS